MRRYRSRSLIAIFRLPLIIALASLAGLVFALLVDGPLDALGWLALALPLILAGVLWWRRRG